MERMKSLNQWPESRDNARQFRKGSIEFQYNGIAYRTKSGPGTWYFCLDFSHLDVSWILFSEAQYVL